MAPIKRERIIICEEVDLNAGDDVPPLTCLKVEIGEDNPFTDETIVPIVKKEEAELDYYQYEEDTRTELKFLNHESIKQEQIEDNSGGTVDDAKSKIIRSGARVINCTLCHVGFPNDILYQEHINKIHADKFPFPCGHCDRRFQKHQHRKRHEIIHDSKGFQGEPLFACDLCDKKYHHKGSLKGHVTKAHFGYKKPSPRPSPAALIEYPAKGKQGQRMTKVKKYLEHMFKDHKKRKLKIYKCDRPGCDYECYRDGPYQLKQHQKKNRCPWSSSDLKRKTRRLCRLGCWTIFDKQNHYERHIKPTMTGGCRCRWMWREKRVVMTKKFTWSKNGKCFVLQA